MKQHDQAVAFAANEIGRHLGLDLVGYQCLNKMLGVVSHHEVFEGLLVPLDLLDPVNFDVD